MPLSTEKELKIAADILLWCEFETPVDFGDLTGRYPGLSDFTFTDMIAHGLLSKLMSELDSPDKSLFPGFLNDKSQEFWKCDLTHMRVVRKPLRGEYVAPSIVLLSRPRDPAPG